MKPNYYLYGSTQYCEYQEFRRWGKLRSMLNRTYNSRIITPELQEFLLFRLNDEAEFHESGWKQAVITDLHNFIVGCASKRRRFEGFLDILDVATRYTNSFVWDAIADAKSEEEYWGKHEVVFPDKPIDPRLLMSLPNGYGLITKATKADFLSDFIDLEVEEFKKGIPTGRTVLVAYSLDGRRFYRGYKEETDKEEIKE